jgi:oxygen-independent coproporphyrinogen III oxidase
MEFPAPRRIHPESLYVHVPFCARKCAYCAFYSEPAPKELTNRYVSALIHELELISADLRPRTVFFGGGTPSLLNLRQWELIFQNMQRLNLMGAAEWTIECNPATVSLDKAKLLRECGVNRISMGVQSLDEALLDRLGRIHTREMVFKSYDILRAAGFDNLNIDLMFAIPGQTMKVWQDTLTEALALGSEHLSSYEIIYEEDTPLFLQLQSGKVRTDEDLACTMYEELVQRAASAGFQQYEIANFARDKQLPGTNYPADSMSRPQECKSAQSTVPAYACRHNVNYWRGGAFYGLGPSATSYVDGVRAKNVSNTQRYCEALEGGGRAHEFQEELAPLSRAGEIAAFGLRMVAGWGFDEFQRTTGYDLRCEWKDELKELSKQGWGSVTEERVRLTSRGLRFADSAAELFLK